MPSRLGTFARSALPLRRRITYAAVLAALLLALTGGALEGGLRLAGYGYSAAFARRAVAADGSVVFRENRWCTAPYFSPELVRRPQPMRLPVHKAPRTYRIFVLGSSAAMGDPEASFSLARVLEKMLIAAYPEVRFEVVNAGITAVNSHVVRGLAADCARLEPDLFIVFEGNNEVIGPFGPSGVFAPFLRSGAAVRLAVALKRSRTGQFVAAAGRAVASREGAAGPDDWGGMEMFLRQRIARDDPRLEAVRAHFRDNLLAIAAAAQDVGARSIICTIPTNERTFAPFASLHADGLGADAVARFDACFAAGEAAVAADDLPAATAAFGAALAIDDRHAEVHFRLGQLALLGGRAAEAREHLRRARDLDALRFRADSGLNDTIRQLPVDESLRIVDTATVLAAASPHGICGDEFLYEHVHLTLRGTYEFARAVLPAIVEDLERRGLIDAGRAPEMPDYDAVRLRLGFTVYEQGMIAAEMLSRLGRAPFVAQSDHRARLDLWQRRAAAARALLARPDALEALRGAMDLALAASPGDWILQRNAGMMLVARDAASDAMPLLQAALSWIDDDVDTMASLALAHLALGHADEAGRLLARVRELEPRHPVVRPIEPTAGLSAGRPDP